MITSVQRQLSVAIENQPGRLGRIGRLLTEREIPTSAFSVITHRSPEQRGLVAKS